jgi:hypothetical protein
VKFRKTLSSIAAVLLLFIPTTTPSFATNKTLTKLVKVVAARPTLLTNLSAAPGDQISSIIATSTAIAYVGTMENSAAAPYTAPQIGGTDGFIAVIDSTGAPIWDLRLGTQQDDIATAVARDKAGNFWVVGVTAKPVATPITPTTSDSQGINVDGVVVDPVTTPNSSLNQLVVWKVDVNGAITATYIYDTFGVILPSAITYSGSKFIITGLVGSTIAQQGFKVEVDSNGQFSKFVSDKTPIKSASGVLVLKVGAGTIKFFNASTSILGIKNWKPKSSTPVLVSYSRSGAITSAYSLQGKVISVTWEAGIGFVALSELGTGYGITIINALA